MASASIDESYRHLDRVYPFHGHAIPTIYHAPLSAISESQPMYDYSQAQPYHARHWGRLIDGLDQHHHELDTNLASYAFTLPDRPPSPEQDPQEEDNHYNDLVQRRRRRNRDRQRRIMDQITMNRTPRAVQPEGHEENVVSPTPQLIPEYFPSTLQADGAEEEIIADSGNQPIQHYDGEGRSRNHQLSETRRARRGSDHSHVMRELWPLDHQLPPAPGDIHDIQWSQMHRGRRVDSSMYWPTDHILPPAPEDAGSYRVEAHPRTRSPSLEHSIRISRIEQILLSLRVELQPLGGGGAGTTELQPLGREGARTTELGDELDDTPPPAYAPPPAYGSWDVGERGLHR
ncbi:hypothetical protein BDV97DRAFT_113920 [Delphinella strobiligena]|nr:hypothetical protein BDV97DRAFT_113920 [Delphinella strobiligena]